LGGETLPSQKNRYWIIKNPHAIALDENVERYQQSEEMEKSDIFSSLKKSLVFLLQSFLH